MHFVSLGAALEDSVRLGKSSDSVFYTRVGKVAARRAMRNIISDLTDQMKVTSKSVTNQAHAICRIDLGAVGLQRSVCTIE